MSERKRKTISQREARALKRRVDELESQIARQRVAWRANWPGGVHLTTLNMAQCESAAREVLTARKLGHAVVVVPREDRKSIELFALPLPEEPK